jgi:hypothetical protein
LTGVKGIVGIRKPIAASGTVNRDWKNVTSDGSIYCYDAFTASSTPQQGPRSTGGLPLVDPKGILFMQLTDATHLKVEWKSATSCPLAAGALQFSATATVFER